MPLPLFTPLRLPTPDATRHATLLPIDAGYALRLRYSDIEQPR